jgi:hypothetical protein
MLEIASFFPLYLICPNIKVATKTTRTENSINDRDEIDSKNMPIPTEVKIRTRSNEGYHEKLSFNEATNTTASSTSENCQSFSLSNCSNVAPASKRSIWLGQYSDDGDEEVEHNLEEYKGKMYVEPMRRRLNKAEYSSNCVESNDDMKFAELDDELSLKTDAHNDIEIDDFVKSIPTEQDYSRNGLLSFVASFFEEVEEKDFVNNEIGDAREVSCYVPEPTGIKFTSMNHGQAEVQESKISSEYPIELIHLEAKPENESVFPPQERTEDYSLLRGHICSREILSLNLEPPGVKLTQNESIFPLPEWTEDYSLLRGHICSREILSLNLEPPGLELTISQEAENNNGFIGIVCVKSASEVYDDEYGSVEEDDQPDVLNLSEDVFDDEFGNVEDPDYSLSEDIFDDEFGNVEDQNYAADLVVEVNSECDEYDGVDVVGEESSVGSGDDFGLKEIAFYGVE